MRELLPYHVFAAQEMRLLGQRFIPKDMDAKWFVWRERNVLCLRRSWMGYCHGHTESPNWRGTMMATDTLQTIDDFSVRDIAAALRRVELTPKMRTMIVALATAKDRAMSRLELARKIGGKNPQSCNGTLGHFGRKLALELDPTLEASWKPKTGTQGDWVMFFNWGPDRLTRMPKGEPDGWVFIMRENLARALDEVEIAPYQRLGKRGNDALSKLNDLDSAEGPFADVNDAKRDFRKLTRTDREAVTLARVGQGIFREGVLQLWERRCAVTGARLTDALVASHIKPWRDSSNKQRLDAANGLLLTAGLDRLFDLSLITFNMDGRIRISPEVPKKEYASLGVSASMRLRGVPPQCVRYLKAHKKAFEKKRRESRGH